jgi:hypothetical protein
LYSVGSGVRRAHPMPTLLGSFALQRVTVKLAVANDCGAASVPPLPPHKNWSSPAPRWSDLRTTKIPRTLVGDVRVTGIGREAPRGPRALRPRRKV